jgi:hypothetical protein
MDLYIDGHIAQMFSPAGAVQYFARLLGVDSRSLRPTLSQEQPHAFFISSQAVYVYASVRSVHPSLAIDGRPLDYVISQAGTIIPQGLWSPPNSIDALRFGNLSLNMPIFFVRNDRTTLGLPLPSAEPCGAHGTLLGAGDMAPVGNGSTTYIRISVSSLSMIKHLRLEVMFLLKFLVLQWPGYGDWSSQIMTRDQTIAHNTITLAKFAKRVANAVVRFLDVSNPFVLRVFRGLGQSNGHSHFLTVPTSFLVQEAERLQGQNPNWRIGAGGITKEDVILVGIVHVSQGSWQPILQLNRYVVPRCHIPELT